MGTILVQMLRHDRGLKLVLATSWELKGHLCTLRRARIVPAFKHLQEPEPWVRILPLREFLLRTG